MQVDILDMYSRGLWEGSSMQSSWLINFKNGNKVILSEVAYKKYDAETPKETVESEEHWFSMDICIKKNPDIDVIE